jgi:hypothetical protein
MRRLLAICSAVGLLCGALGCQSCQGLGKMHGRCDCDNGPQYGCCFDMYTHGPDHAAPASSTMPMAEVLKPMPKEVKPKDEGQ